MSLESNSAVIGLGAAVFVWTAHVAVPLGFAALAATRMTLQRRRARMADARWVETAPLEPGEAVVHGTVELAPGRSAAVRVEIVQAGTETKTKNGWAHTWSEISRKVQAEPFYVRDRRGATVRVEPGPDAMLVDALDQLVGRDGTLRTRAAELSEGEEVYVIGELTRGHDPDAGGYRDASGSLVLKPPSRGRMLCSTEALGERFRRHADRERGSMKFFLGYAGVLALFDASYHARVHAGVRETGAIVSAHEITGKNSRCALEIRMPNGETFRDDVPSGYCRTLRPGSPVPIVHPGSSWLAHVGAEPGLHLGILIPSSILLVLAIVIYLARDRPWYEAKVVDRGSGRLA